MGSKLQRNAILMGYVNSYCLVCERYFDTEIETSEHIQDSDHKDNLQAHPYLDKYGDNHIRKIKKGYFCEFCSVLLSTAAKVSFHIQESAHYEKKGSFLLRRLSGVSAVVAFDNLLIDERAWHSLSEETCAICNEEFDNENIHKTESAHLLKLVQNKVEFGPGNTLYRKTDDTSFQCLTCNAVLGLNTLDDHFTDADHKKLYEKCQDEYKKYYEQNKQKSEETKQVKDKKMGVKEIDLKNENKKPKNDIEEPKNDLKQLKNNDTELKVDIKELENDAKESATKVNENNNAIQNPVNTNKAKTSVEVPACCEIVPVKTTELPEDEATVFATANDLTYNAGNPNAFCRICETKLPANLRSMKEHATGKEHKNRVGRMKQSKAQKINSNLTKKPMKKFIETCVNVENIFREDVVINEQICISGHSFHMMTKTGEWLRCQACEVTVYEGALRKHIQTDRHTSALEVTPVVTSLPALEFFREVRPGIFHCGCCNQIVPEWSQVASHLQSREHRENKDRCMWQLRRFLPSVLEHHRQQERVMFEVFLRQQFMRY